MQLFNEEIKREDAEYLVEWLKDARGKVFWKWIKDESQNCHDRASEPVGDNPIRDILRREGHLMQENAFDQISGFLNVVLDQIEEDKKTK